MTERAGVHWKWRNMLRCCRACPWCRWGFQIPGGLYPLWYFTSRRREQVLTSICRWQDVMMKRHGIHFVHASDEWYLLAGRKLPEEEQYDGYLQLENGVGMLRLLLDEVDEALESLGPDDRKEQRVTLPLDVWRRPTFRNVEKIQRKFRVCRWRSSVENRFFGETITVSGLLTGQDLRNSFRAGYGRCAVAALQHAEERRGCFSG